MSIPNSVRAYVGIGIAISVAFLVSVSYFFYRKIREAREERQFSQMTTNDYFATHTRFTKDHPATGKVDSHMFDSTTNFGTSSSSESEKDFIRSPVTFLSGNSQENITKSDQESNFISIMNVIKQKDKLQLSKFNSSNESMIIPAGENPFLHGLEKPKEARLSTSSLSSSSTLRSEDYYRTYA